MRITVELPDELLRRIKIYAAMTDRKLKELVPVLLAHGLDAEERARTATPPRRRSPRLPGGPLRPARRSR
jgi:hypothetical protein